jgi:hypothetical protein
MGIKEIIIMEKSIACDLTVFSAEERTLHITTSNDLTSKAKRISELEDGYAFLHDYADETFVAIARWATNESKCCPFFTFELVLQPTNNGREIILRLRGNKEAKQLLKTGLEQLDSEKQISMEI